MAAAPLAPPDFESVPLRPSLGRLGGEGEWRRRTGEGDLDEDAEEGVAGSLFRLIGGGPGDAEATEGICYAL